jgi:hypothetical protein
MRTPTMNRTALAVLLVLATSTGCGTLKSGRAWGQDATLLPGWARIRDAAWKNASDARTWAPLAGAALMRIGNLDRSISDWARERTPVYGSTHAADWAGIDLDNALHRTWYVSMFATKSGDDALPWLESKLKGVVVEYIAHDAASTSTGFLKDAVPRERPNGSSMRSFPSGIATSSFGYARLTSDNLESTDLPDSFRPPVRYTIYALAIGASWARVEAGGHYPSDVLFAAGTANFLTGFVHDAFLGLSDMPAVSVARAPDERGWMLGLTWCL